MNFGCLPSYLGRLPSYLGRLPLSVNLTSAPTYHLTTANDHFQPVLHDFGCGACVKLFKIENLPQTRFLPEKSIKRFGTLKWSQEGENSVGYLRTIDLQYTKGRRFRTNRLGWATLGVQVS